jgi:hypothetical protein
LLLSAVGGTTGDCGFFVYPLFTPSLPQTMRGRWGEVGYLVQIPNLDEDALLHHKVI